MDAGNDLGPEGAASLAPALEKMPQLTSLHLGETSMVIFNRIGPEGAASLAPALEKMTQLTSLDLASAGIRFWARPRGLGGPGRLCVLLGTRLDAMWCGWGTRLRAGDACDGLRDVC
jgi:hypothetical protein